MKVFCIDDGGFQYLTTGKWYEVIDELEMNYMMIDNRGFFMLYLKYLFKTKQEVREEKFKQLGL